MELIINIFDRDLVWVGMLDSVVYLKHSSSWHEITNSELKVSRSAANVEEIKTGRILVVNNQTDKALIIEEMQTTLDDKHWIITCIPLKGMLNYRIVHPTDSFATLLAKSQAYVMMNIPSVNLVTQTRDKDRYFWNTTATKNLFSVATTKVYGETIDFTADWNTGLMGDCISEIAKMNSAAGSYPIGWNVYINTTWDGFQMDTYKARDRTGSVIFSEEFGNIKSANYLYSIKEWKNVVYMTWNDGTVDKTTAVGNTAYGATKGFVRREMIQSSSKKTANEVTAEGTAALNQKPHTETFTAEIINNPNTISTYGTDWILGDIVTVQSADLQISISAQITQIDETYENGDYVLDATFGEPKPNFVQLIKRAIRK